jgi:hypothetical protein
MTDLHQLRKRSPCRLPRYKEAFLFILLVGCFLGGLFLSPPEAEANRGKAPTMDQLSGVYEVTATVVRDDPNWPISVTVGQELSVWFSMGLYSEDHGQMAARFRRSVPDVPFTYDYSTNTAVGSAELAMGNHCRSESSFSYNDGEFYYEVKNFCTQSPDPVTGKPIVHGYWKEMPGYTIMGTAFFDGESYVIEAEDANVEYRFVLIEPINLVDLNPGLEETIPDQENEVVENGTIDDEPEEPSPVDVHPSQTVTDLALGNGQDSDPASSFIPGLEGFGSIPGPDGFGQAMAGILIPGIISIILGILGQSGAAVAPSGGAVSSPAKAGSVYDFGDGRDYYEGQSYTFDNGKKYKIDNGEFVPTADLRDGEVYTDPDGNRKIWIGGQAWHEADWRRQEAANDAYKQAHKQDVDSYWEKRQQEIRDEQAALQAEEKAQAEHEAYIEDEPVEPEEPAGEEDSPGEEAEGQATKEKAEDIEQEREEPINTVTDPDGTVIETFANGDILETQPDGTQVLSEPDGTISTKNIDGSINVTDSHGSDYTIDPEGNIAGTIKKEDGTDLTIDPEGSGVHGTIVQEGTTTALDPEGNTTITVSEEGGSVTVDPEGNRTIKTDDGIDVITDPDGNIISGTRKTEDGTDITYGPDGSIKGTMKTEDGSSTYDLTKDPEGNYTGTIKTENGTNITIDPDGSIKATDSYGTNLIKDPEGSLTGTIKTDDGTNITIDPDESITLTTPEGASLRKDVDGTLTLSSPDGGKAISHPDGSMTLEFSDGTKEVYNPQEADQLRNSDGSYITRLFPQQ